MDDITRLCSDIEYRLESFELANSIKVGTIHIERNDRGEIMAVKVVASGEYRNQNHE